MNKFLQIFILAMILMPYSASGQVNDSIIGRPYKMFDVTAYCSYSSFHPSDYLTDNNWDILCAFTEAGTVDKLDSLGIPYTKSQLRLLEVGDLISSKNGTYATTMSIFGKAETQQIRQQSKEFADSIFKIIQPDIRNLISKFDSAGYSKQTFSLVFSYMLDTYIWDDERLPSADSCEDHGTWSGAFWAMYSPRTRAKIGTNSFGHVFQNWTNDLGYWLSSSKLISFAKEVAKSNGGPIEDKNVIASLEGWGLIDGDGNIMIPVMRVNDNSGIDCLCKKITDILSDAVKNFCHTWYAKNNIASEQLGQIIFYHEVMWDLLDILESKGVISMPSILKGEEVGRERFGDICFIVIEE